MRHQASGFRVSGLGLSLGQAPRVSAFDDSGLGHPRKWLFVIVVVFCPLLKKYEILGTSGGHAGVGIR